MPRLPLAGPPYPSRSLAAAASELTNLFIETVEDPMDASKNVANLFGTPGRHAIVDLSSHHPGDVRGTWSGGGRCFVAVGAYVYEIDSAGSVVGDVHTLTIDDGNPVTFFGNGNQLGLVYTDFTGDVETGYFLINNGDGWVQARFQISGSVKAVGTAITWQAGQKFTAEMVGRTVTIDGHILICTVFTNDTHITVNSGLGNGAGTCTTWANEVFWQTGDQFGDYLNGQPITIDGVQYIVQSVASPQALVLTTQVPGDIAFRHGLAFTFGGDLNNLAYNSPAGDPVTAITGAYLDETFHVQRPVTVGNGSQINRSEPLDGTNWDGLNFYSKEGGADHTRSILADGGIMYAFGVETSEAFQTNTSTGEMQRIPGSQVKFGSISHWGPNAVGGKVYFVGGDSEGGPVAYRVDSSVPTRISNHAIEAYWRQHGFGPGCVSYTEMWDGHVFWCINFGDETWCWDETEKAWHRRMGWNGSAFTAHPIRFHTYIPEWDTGKHISGGIGSRVYETSLEFYDDDGDDIGWRRAIPPRYNQGNRIYFGRMQLEMETGTVPSGAAPLITRDYSDNRGKTFVNPQTVSAGVHDDTGLLLYWLRGGCSRFRIWRFSGSGQYKVALIDLECDEILGTT